MALLAGNINRLYLLFIGVGFLCMEYLLMRYFDELETYKEYLENRNK
jgi:hypothetical protein